MANDKTRQCWSDMKQRCLNSRHVQFKNYGQRGIQICDRWLESYENFLMDMGRKPEGLTLERVDNNGNYIPSNCRWASRKEQRLNQRTCNYVEVSGRRMTLRDAARMANMPEQTLLRRISKMGMTVDAAMRAPINWEMANRGAKGNAKRWNAALAAQTEKGS